MSVIFKDDTTDLNSVEYVIKTKQRVMRANGISTGGKPSYRHSPAERGYKLRNSRIIRFFKRFENLKKSNNINSRLDATMIILLTISISSTCFGRNYRPKHVELIEIVNKIIIVASSRLFILLHQ